MDTYDKTSPISIENYAKELIGHTFEDILPKDFINYKGKGGLGQLLEKYYFYYTPNSDKNPDFKEAGVELKLTPYKKNKNGSYSAKERLVLNIINYIDIVNESFNDSSFLKKNKTILLIYYFHDFNIQNKLKYKINYAQLFEFPPEDLQIIKNDWNRIVNKIKDGLAHELSEGDTLYLGACTKGSKKEESYRNQPFSNVNAPQRAFSLKSSYMTYILRNYILRHKSTYEPIIKDDKILENQTFEEYVINKISNYNGYSIDYLCKKFNISSTSKDKTSQVALKILGVTSKNAEEFRKANIKVKTIRLKNTGTIEQSMSFKNFKFKDIIKESWNTSELRTMFYETRFFFIIYRFDENNNLLLHDCMFWSMPLSDLDKEVKRVWEETVKIIKDGVITWEEKGRTKNNFPKKSFSEVCHVRPKAPNKDSVYELPDGRTLTKQCFWLNNTYILKQITSK